MLFVTHSKSGIARQSIKTHVVRFASAFLVLLLGSGGAHATQYSTTGTITLARSSSLLTGAQMGGTTIIQMSAAFATGCNWLWVGSNDPNTLAALFEAKMTQANVTIWYETTDAAPWGDTTSCGVTAIQQN